MRMKWNKSGKFAGSPATGLRRWGGLMLAAAACLGVASLIAGCATLTVDFVYVTSAKAAGPSNYGEIDVFEVNSESGRMRQITTSPFPSGGRNPVAEAVSSAGTSLYVVNEDDNSIVQFTIGNDGKVYPQNTYNTPGVFPLAVAVAGQNLFVVDTYQPLPICSPAAPCSGSVAVYPINKDGSLGTPVTNPAVSAAYWPLSLPASPKDVIAPTAITALPGGSAIYIAANDLTAGGGYVFGFSVSNGVLTAIGGGVPAAAGLQPSAITCDATGSYVYVTDQTGSDVLGYSVAAGGLTPLAGSPYPAGNKPSAVVVDQTGKYAYVANALDSTITGYTISGGVLTRIASYATDTQPVAIGIDPSANEYLYTANFLGNTVTGFQISATSGSLVSSQFSPFQANSNPTAVAAVTHNAVSKQ
jgi:6-phosphogluconolactonase